jgi:hypothetical protein
LALSLAAWVGVWAFWLAVTNNFHPSLVLAVVVTTSLVVAYAAAAYINHLILVPRLWAVDRRWRYAAWLVGTMAVLTGVALAVIRAAYFVSLGPDPDPYGMYKHYVIDLFGMAVHLLVAAAVVTVARRFCRPRTRGVPAERGASRDPAGL